MRPVVFIREDLALSNVWRHLKCQIYRFGDSKVGVDLAASQHPNHFTVGFWMVFVIAISQVISREELTCDSVHSWQLHSAAPLADQTPHSYPDTELTSLCPMLIMPSACLESDKYTILSLRFDSTRVQIQQSPKTGDGRSTHSAISSGPGSFKVEHEAVFWLGFYVLATSNVISVCVPTCTVHTHGDLYSAASLGDQAACTMNWYAIQSHYPDTEIPSFVLSYLWWVPD